MIKLNKKIEKRIATDDCYSEEGFIRDAKTYINAVKSGRILYDVVRVSKSGMSRVINIRSFEGKMSGGYYRTYGVFLKALGYSMVDYNNIRVYGSGMNMLFHTNYCILHDLHSMGFITNKTCDTLAQKVN
jgi:hypothetical protein